MAQPTPYQPAHEFWNDEGLLPLLPGSELDIEFGAIDNTLTEILANLALIQRDDGAIANATIGLDQLTTAVKAMIGDIDALEAIEADIDAIDASVAAAAASAAAALVSETNAETAETNAETAQTAAEAARDAALVAKAAAETAETNAETAETNAEAARDAALAAQAAAEAALDAFDDVYLGSKAADPTLDNDGNALVEGQLYWNSSANELRVYDGAAWQAYSAAGISDIVGDTTPQLGGTLDTNAQQIRWSKGADVASANALALGDDGNYFDITGTTAITSIGTKAVGTVVKLHFDAALTLTHQATDLILPGGANITTAAGDEAEFVEYATGDWRCTNYVKANGNPLKADAIGAIGGTTPADGAFTTLSATGLITATGGQIAFPATQNASSGPNTLDDYEEGTFTPTMAYATPGTSSFSYASQVGFYTKIGNLVQANIYLDVTPTEGTASGNVQIDGLPFTASSANAIGSLALLTTTFSWPASTTSAYCRTNASTTYLTIQGMGSATAAVSFTVSNTATGSGHQLRASVCYLI